MVAHWYSAKAFAGNHHDSRWEIHLLQCFWKRVISCLYHLKMPIGFAQLAHHSHVSAFFFILPLINPLKNFINCKVCLHKYFSLNRLFVLVWKATKQTRPLKVGGKWRVKMELRETVDISISQEEVP